MSSSPDVRFSQRLEEARRVHARGDVAGALRLYGDLRKEAPQNAKLLQAFGVALAQSGRLAEAATHLQRAIEIAPRDPDILHDVAALRDAQGRPSEALAMIYRVVEVAPERVGAWEAIGMYERDQANFEKSAEAYLRAYRLAPNRPDLALNASAVMPAQEGAELLIECLERHPGDESLLLPLADALMRCDRAEEAAETLRILRTRRPSSGQLSRHLATAYVRMRRYPEAAAALYEAVVREPHDAESWHLLASVRDAIGDGDGAWAAVDRAISIKPTDPVLIGLRARLQQLAGRVELAQEGLRNLSEKVRSTSNVRMLSGMLLPPIVDSNEQIDAVRARWMEAMADVEARPTFTPEPWDTIAVTGYFLGYHGREDRAHLEALARASLAASPHLAYTSPSLAGGGGGEKIKVGFVSAYMKNHSVGRVLNKLMGGLDRGRFEVVLFQLPDTKGGGDEHGEQAADKTVRLVRQLESSRSAIEAERPDVLIYCDLHLNPFSDALSFSRLAPVQATTWGHPGTGGKETLDYWISHEYWEPNGSERHYTESLVRLPSAPYVAMTPLAKPQPLKRSEVGLKDDARLYGCLQSLFKIHPDFDAYLAGILERDPKARILLSGSPYPTWRDQARNRLSRSLDIGRVDFLPTMPHANYLGLLELCDVQLDPIHFGGAITTLDAFYQGQVVVTQPGDQMRGRVTAGLYRQIGYEKPVAQSREEYVDLAIRIANDRALREEGKAALLDSRNVLFENPAPVADFEAWLQSVVRR
ncbi:tetratricopeptide repeat protein [bacterium]|nr:MAG: tetratricopeptide repeat protein [bacterium]